MSNAPERRTPLTLLGGFLGSGKTTWLRHQLHQGKMKDALVVVNEAANAPVDDILLFQSAEIRVLAGGCACCDGREELIALLRQFCNERVDPHHEGQKFDGIVLETSGLADPSLIVEAIRSDPVLVHHIVVHEIVVAFDAFHGLGYLQNEPLGKRQVETADRLIITKCDAVKQADLQHLLASLQRVNPAAAICGSVMGSETPLPAFDTEGGEVLPDFGESECRPVLSTVLDLGDMDWTAFTVWLSALLHARGDEILRVKGVVKTEAGKLLLQSVCRVMQSPEVLPDDHDEASVNSVVFIGRGFCREDLVASLDFFNRQAIGTIYGHQQD